ncbi:MAG TPA: hypothetical protein VKR22_11170, partial [Acidimicrobiales bacterium]|nr:hypothetical protein [Acidimicrobiales bacterium]
HEGLFRWLERTFPGGKVYGPYEHGGRRYLQWMARGHFLRDTILPMIEPLLTAQFDEYAQERLLSMRQRYPARLTPPSGDASDS